MHPPSPAPSRPSAQPQKPNGVPSKGKRSKSPARSSSSQRCSSTQSNTKTVNSGTSLKTRPPSATAGSKVVGGVFPEPSSKQRKIEFADDLDFSTDEEWDTEDGSEEAERTNGEIAPSAADRRLAEHSKSTQDILAQPGRPLSARTSATVEEHHCYAYRDRPNKTLALVTRGYLQATLNLGTVGHVAHRKLTVVKVISGVMTVRFKNELVRNISPSSWATRMQKCVNKAYLGQGCYRSYHSDKEDRLPCEDASIIWSCFAPDFEHLAAVESMKLQNITILQNKVGLVKEAQALEHQKSIASFVKGTVAEASLIVPISAQLKYNIDAVNEYVMKRIPIPVWDFMSSPWLVVIHSFDVNKFGTEVNERMGGVTRGSILAGVLALEMRIEIYPGIVMKDQQGCKRCRPIFSCIITLLAENNQLQFAVPSGLGVGTLIDLMLCRADRLVGQVLGAVSKLSQIYTASAGHQNRGQENFEGLAHPYPLHNARLCAGTSSTSGAAYTGLPSWRDWRARRGR
ncbi:hypothetical protein DFH11DRAFT_1729866 [Phellopilus nigrolimitatus]|nr:hypothetical protein DFH11DRAFT_1729866 [Phellopilus nigrolimitatus]